MIYLSIAFILFLYSQIINFTINEAIFHIFNCIFVIFTTDIKLRTKW